MMDMNILPDAAPAAPGGQATKSGAPSHEDGFDAFNVTLRDVLDRASAGEDDPLTGGDGGDTGQDTGAAMLSTLWLRLTGGQPETGVPAGETADTAANEAEPAAGVDETALAIAAAAMAAAPVSAPAAPIEGVSDQAIAVDDLPRDRASASGGTVNPSAGAWVNPSARAEVNPSAGAEVAPPTGVKPPVIVRLTTPAVEHSQGQAALEPGAEAKPTDVPVEEPPRAAVEGSDDGRAGSRPSVPGSAARETPGSPLAPVRTPTPISSGVATKLVEELKAVVKAASADPAAPADPAAQAAAAAIEAVPSAQPESAGNRPPARQAGAQFGGAPLDPSQHIEPVVRHASQRDTDGEHHRDGAGEFLRRSTMIESRLSPPSSFTVPTVTTSGPPVPVTTAATTYTVTLPPAFEMPAPAQNLSRLVQSMQVQARDGISQASVRLHPEHLGEVTIAVRVENGAVTALVRAEQGDVRQWLRGQEDAIRSGLAEQGLTLDELVVEDDGRRHQHEQQEDQQRQKRGSRRRAPSANFEVLV